MGGFKCFGHTRRTKEDISAVMASWLNDILPEEKKHIKVGEKRLFLTCSFPPSSFFQHIRLLPLKSITLYNMRLPNLNVRKVTAVVTAVLPLLANARHAPFSGSKFQLSRIPPETDLEKRFDNTRLTFYDITAGP